jgi:hypothetical protein
MYLLQARLDRVVIPSSATINTWSFDSPIFDLVIHVNTLLAPFGLSYMIGSKKCTTWENMSLRFGGEIKGFNPNCLERCRPMERDDVHMNLVRATKTTFDGIVDVKLQVNTN